MVKNYKKVINFICIISTLLWGSIFIFSKINWETAQLINNSTIFHYLKYSYYNFGTLFIVNIFCFFNLLFEVVNFFKRKKEKQVNQSSKLFSISYFIVSVIAYTIHFLVFKYFLEGAFAG